MACWYLVTMLRRVYERWRLSAASAVVVFTLVLGHSTASGGSDPAATTPLDAAALEQRLKANVRHLAGTIGERNIGNFSKLEDAARWISEKWKAQGLAVREFPYTVEGHQCKNLEVDVAGPAGAAIVLVGAHYDSVENCPGADDNATGVAAMLEISRALAKANVAARIRCVAFVNEEPPYFETDDMGSMVYARLAARRGDTIQDMLALETLGYFTDRKGSQEYPPLLSALYPDTGNFIGVVGDLVHADAVNRTADLLKKYARVPVERASLLAQIPGVSWSDHASFWASGYTGVMITDTAPFRNRNYHKPSDKPESLDYRRLGLLTAGLIETVRDLASSIRKSTSAPMSNAHLNQSK